jgi:hypothetical protein
MINTFLRLIVVGTLGTVSTVAHETNSEPPRIDFLERFGSERPVELSPTQRRPSREPIPPGTQVLTFADVQRDPALLPPPVRAVRERLIGAARSGDLAQLSALVAESTVEVKIDNDPVDDPAAFWRSQYPDSEGRELLAILLDLLDTGFVQVDIGTANEMFVWPYAAHVPLASLGPRELVEILRLVTSYDLQQMREAGSWTFFRIGIAPDGTWHYFIARE